MPTLYPRLDTQRVRVALADTPVVLLNGPRQSGKTTLARELLGTARTFRTLDDDSTLASATADPVGFLRGAQHLTIDEVQRAPGLLRAIKKSVDEDRQPGRFLLTGSTDVLSLPHVADSLAGRMTVIDLLPLAQVELSGVQQPGFIRAAFEGTLRQQTGSPVTGAELEDIVLTGGYPEMLRRTEPTRRTEWARNYLRAIVQRDVRDIAGVDKLGHMPRLLRALAHHSGQLVNYAQLGGQLAIDAKTARKYIDIFQQLFLVRALEPWSANRLARLIKTPKLHFLDSGLLAALLPAATNHTTIRGKAFGAILESFVYAELTKLAAWEGADYQLFHYRDKDQDEVDIVIEDAAGNIVGVEVKSAATVSTASFRGLHKLERACGARFRCGIVLYDGDVVLPFGSHAVAAPISNLWTASAK